MVRVLLSILLAVTAQAGAADRIPVDSTFYRGDAVPTTIRELLATSRVPPGFEPLDGRTISVRATADHWFLVDIEHELASKDSSKEWMLRIDFTGLDAVEVYVARGSKLLYRASVGDEVPLERWPLPARVPTIPLSMNGKQADRVFLHPASTGQPMVLPLTLVDDETRRADAEAVQLWYGFFFGASLAFVAYTGCLWLATRNGDYLAFAVYLSAFTLVILTTSGIGRLWLWPSVEGVTTRLSLAMIGLTTATITLFVDRFLELKRTSPRMHRCLLAWAGLTLLPVAVLPFVPYMRVQPTLHVIALLTLVILATISVARLRHGSRPARFLVVAYAVLFSAVVLGLLRYNGLVPSEMIGEHLVEVAVLFEALVLCVGLADSIAAIRAEQRAAVARELAARERNTGLLIAAHESERRRFGAILHDDIGHGVATLRYGLAEVFEHDACTGACSTALARLHEDCGAIIDDLRRLARESHPHLLAQLGLDGALRSLFGAALDPLGIEWRVDCCRQSQPRATEEHLYRVAQECLTNSLKHAEPARISLSIESSGAALTLRYEDDGTGADPTVLAESERGAGFGLVSIRERARLLGGRCTIETLPERGFKLRIETIDAQREKHGGV